MGIVNHGRLAFVERRGSNDKWCQVGASGLFGEVQFDVSVLFVGRDRHGLCRHAAESVWDHQFDLCRLRQPVAALQAEREFRPIAGNCGERSTFEREGQFAGIDESDHLIVLGVRAIADGVSAAVGVGDDAHDSQRRAAGAANFHPGWQLHGEIKFVLSR